MNVDHLLDALISTPGPNERAGIPAVLWGSPGTGKTASLYRAARRHGLHAEVILLSLRDPSDIAGLPVPSKAGIKLEPPAWARRLAEAGKGLLILDELSCAPGAVQAAALRIVAEGVVGELELPKEVRVLAAANPADEAAGGWELSAPMANRLAHISWPEPDPQAWGAWLVGDGAGGESPARGMSPEAWEHEWILTRAGVAALIRARPNLLLSLPKTESERGRAWASPRSWELAARSLAGARAMGLGDGMSLMMIGACVGEGVAAEAWEYLSKLDLPDPDDVLAGKAKIPTNRGDRAYASLSTIVATVLRDPADSERRVVALECAAEVAKHHADVAVAVTRPLNQQVGHLLRKFAARVGKAYEGPLQQVAEVFDSSLRKK